ncbi:hypothetical protein H4R33_003070 [Dimargaris cristalligena]|nr:hypothetical protein H4R33_003070 [Dimargaris cristalligena]
MASPLRASILLAGLQRGPTLTWTALHLQPVALACLSAIRTYSTRGDLRSRFSLTDFGVFTYRQVYSESKSIPIDLAIDDRFVPLTQQPLPSIFSKLSFKYRIHGWRCKMRTTMAIATVKTRMNGKFKIPAFLDEAVTLYEVMNDSFASGDRKLLQHICMPSMLTKLKYEIKNRKHRVEWKSHGQVEPPSLVSLATAKLSSDILATQAVVRIYSKQSMVIYDHKNKVISDNSDSPIDVLEYLVYQAIVENGQAQWKIYGKLNETNLDTFKP